MFDSPQAVAAVFGMGMAAAALVGTFYVAVHRLGSVERKQAAQDAEIKSLTQKDHALELVQIEQRTQLRNISESLNDLKEGMRAVLRAVKGGD